MVLDMALDKRFDYGFRGYQLPPTPRAARSARRRGLFKRKANDQQMCAFDLLATVAGKLLLDGDTCQPPANTSFTKEHAPLVLDTNTIIKEEKDDDKPLEEKISYQDCCERNFLLTELISENPNPYPCLNKPGCAQNDVISRPTSGMKPYCSEKVGPTEQLVNDDCKLQLGIFTPLEVESSGIRLSTNPELEDESEKDVKIESANNRNLYISDKAFQCSSGHVENAGRKSSALVCSVNNVKFPFSEDHPPCGSFLVGDTVKLVTRDDDENSFECTRNKAIKIPQRFGDGRLRKLLPSKHCRITSNVKDKEGYTGESSTCPSKDSGFKWQRSLRDFPFKKRKLYECGSMPNSDEGIISTDRTCRVPENGGNGDSLSCGPNQPGVTPAPTSVPGGCVSFHSRNSQVKLKIKSFRVPELVIEIPETATVGSLKTTVMEAVNSVLGGGLHVGVLFQGKKIRDDNKTLAQTGICIDNKMDMVGFSLEPRSDDPAPIRAVQMQCQRYHPTARASQRNIEGCPNVGLNKLMERGDSVKQDAMALRKSKRCESAQRRIRRPFTVAEVEALVQAVEKLGTGRWRDVKLRAFDSAKHRTYVDLKDKWKTLVHTARISPQQRRGEPVPQQLLDRVLTAHAYWSHQQAKSHPDTCLLL